MCLCTLWLRITLTTNQQEVPKSLLHHQMNLPRPTLNNSRYVVLQLIVFAVVIVAVVKADCQFFLAVDVVVIVAAVVAVYFSLLPSWRDDDNRHHCCCKRGRVKGASSDTIVGEGEGGGLFPLYCRRRGNDANYPRYRCKGDSGKRHFLTSSWEREKGRVDFPSGYFLLL